MKTALQLVVLVAISATLFGCDDKKVKRSGDSYALIAPSYIDYYLPETMAVVDAKYTLTECNKVVSVDHPTIKINAKFALAANPRPDIRHRFKIDYDELPKSRTAQDLTLNLTEKGLLKSVNTTAADKTGTIISNVLGIATKVIGLNQLFGVDGVQMFGPTGQASSFSTIKLECSAQAKAFLDEVKALEADIKKAKAERRKDAPSRNNPKSSLEKYQAYDRYIALLEARKALIVEKKLTLKIKHRIDLDVVDHEYAFGLTISQLVKSKWSGLSAPTTDVEKLVYELLGIPIGKLILRHKPSRETINLGCTYPYIDKDAKIQCAATEADQKASGNPWSSVSNQLYFLRPFETQYVVLDYDSDFKYGDQDEINQSFESIAHLQKPPHGLIRIAQWGNLETIDFDVGIFQKRTVKISQEESGYISALTMNEDARLAAATGGVSSILGSASDLAKQDQSGADAAELEYLKREVELRKKRKELQELIDEEDEL